MNTETHGWAQALLDPEADCPPGLTTWNSSDPATRFAVYRNNVVCSLVDGLAAAFPVVQALVGEDFFRAMAAVFVRRAPPRSPVLLATVRALPSSSRPSGRQAGCATGPTWRGLNWPGFVLLMPPTRRC